MTGPPRSILSVCLLVILSSVHANSEVSSITAIKGIKVAHHTLAERPTACTVVLAEAGAVAAVDILGSAAANVTADAIVRGVLAATSLPGYPSVRDFQGGVH